ncbi:transcriptional regulator [Klebsiella pneumoniae]|uniref:Transcriptional regulator n=1 Tax=Klebsiella pneumoniae TaxID=573 RepID=A0A377UUL5_KLEPN|nr:transcriptional regulator [Klebsiella pneumoniae]
MSTSPSVIRRFVEYYAGLDAQPPAALARCTIRTPR